MKSLTSQQLHTIQVEFKQGQKAIQLGLLQQAEKHFLKILKLKPDVNEANAALAYIYTATKQHAKAESKLKLLLKANPNHGQTHFNLANCLYEQKLYQKAIAHYHRSIKLEPKLIDAYINCSISNRMLKAYSDAIKLLHKALDIDNSNARAFYILGMVYADIEDYPRALECLENATGLAPNNPEFTLDFANTLDKASLDQEAGLAYHKACESNPKHLASFLLYAEFLQKSNRHDEAIECLSHARSLETQNTKTVELIAKSYAAMNNTDAAAQYFHDALNQQPARISSLIGLGQLYQDSGDTNKGIDIAEKIIDLDKNKTQGYALKAHLKKSTDDDGLVDQINSLINRVKMDDDNKISTHFALGKIYNDRKNYDRAFEAYKVANATKDKQLDYDKSISENAFDKIKQTFDSELFEKFKSLATSNKQPILIVGMPRSGTTLTEQIISSHPEVIGAGEVTFWGKTPSAMPLRINSEKTYPDCIHDLTPEDAQNIVNLYEGSLRKIVGSINSPKHITDKMPHNFLYVGLIALLCPEVKIIHTQRDPIDTCLSIYFQNFNNVHSYASNLDNLVHHYKLYEDLMAHWHAILPNRIFDIKYEDTITDPEHWSRQLIKHIGLEWDEACLAPHKLERTVKTASHWQVRQPIYKTSVQRWKNYESHLKPLLDAFH